ncbi:MAG: NUDIX hydrolase [Candidatus Dormiibacterota bacterium]
MGLPSRRDAATVVLLRQGSGHDDPSGRLEVLLLGRPAASRFAPGAEVFPGGSVDPSDAAPGWRQLLAGGTRDAAVAPRIMIAAVRETFEECGVLLARDGSGRPCPPQLLAGLAGLRQLIHDGHPEEFRAGLSRAGLRPAWEDLIFSAHWVTPAGMPRIFDTRFFLAALPAGQEAQPDAGGELASMRWVGPAQALKEAEQGRCLLLPPTRSVLAQLTAQPTVAAALAAAHATRVRRVRPQLAEITTERYPGLDLEAIHPGDGSR